MEAVSRHQSSPYSKHEDSQAYKSPMCLCPNKPTLPHTLRTNIELSNYYFQHYIHLRRMIHCICEGCFTRDTNSVYSDKNGKHKCCGKKFSPNSADKKREALRLPWLILVCRSKNKCFRTVNNVTSSNTVKNHTFIPLTNV